VVLCYDALNVIPENVGIARDESTLLALSLRNQDPIEGITMDGWQGPEFQGVSVRYGQFHESVLLDYRRKVVGDLKLSQRFLQNNFPN